MNKESLGCSRRGFFVLISYHYTGDTTPNTSVENSACEVACWRTRFPENEGNGDHPIQCSSTIKKKVQLHEQRESAAPRTKRAESEGMHWSMVSTFLMMKYSDQVAIN